jgi:hypothetical protein
MRRSGELLRFHLRGDAYFPVDTGFPRLPDDYSPPPGVVSVKYTVDLANLPSIDMSKAKELVKAGFCQRASSRSRARSQSGSPGHSLSPVLVAKGDGGHVVHASAPTGGI